MNRICHATGWSLPSVFGAHARRLQISAKVDKGCAFYCQSAGCAKGNWHVLYCCDLLCIFYSGVQTCTCRCNRKRVGLPPSGTRSLLLRLKEPLA